MKKTLKMILCLSLVLAMALSMVACGDKKEEKASIAGHYDLASMTIDGKSFTQDELAALMGDLEIYVELNDDGTGVLSLSGETADMAWKDGQIWPVDEPDEKVPFTVEGKTLTMEIDGQKMVFEKN